MTLSVRFAVKMQFLNLPQPENIEVCANAFRGHAIHSDWSTRFVDAYNVEIQEWIDATKKEEWMGQQLGMDM